jgi:hypothetical protein
VHGFTDEFKVTGYTTFKVNDKASNNSVKYYANEYMKGVMIMQSLILCQMRA